VGDLARKHGVSEGTIYAWKAKFGGMSVSEAQRLKVLEGENRRLFVLLRRNSQPAYYDYGLGDQVQLSAEIIPVRLR